MKNFTQIQIIPDKLKAFYLSLLDPVVRLSTRWKLNPNTFTTLSFLLGLTAALLVSLGHIRWAGGVLLLSGMFDNLDGRLARYTGRVTKFGALYDSTLDRYQETVFFLGLFFFYIPRYPLIHTVGLAFGMIGSFMVSYIRARAESLGFHCHVGMVQRAERLILLGIGCILYEILVPIVWIIAVLTNMTAVQRLLHVYKTERQETISVLPKGKDH
ncbi:MAG TPA: CDP-alcohol phosphatidyltransferase family protein [bacterium]|nr:CDP-alcohol phosphatidyltransferase family protein [bacterium]